MPSARIVRLTLALIIGALAAFATYRVTTHASNASQRAFGPRFAGPFVLDLLFDASVVSHPNPTPTNVEGNQTPPSNVGGNQTCALLLGGGP